MEQRDIDPAVIGIWNTFVKVHDEPLEIIVKREGWSKIPRVPVFVLPEGYEHQYVLIDGHGRHFAAVRTGSLLPCNVYQPGETFDPEGLAPFRYQHECSNPNFFNKILALYHMFLDALDKA